MNSFTRNVIYLLASGAVLFLLFPLMTYLYQFGLTVQ